MKALGIIIIFSLISLSPHSFTSLSSLNQTPITLTNSNNTMLITKEHEQINDILVYNQTQNLTYLLIAFMNHFESYILNRISNAITLNFNTTFGLNKSSYVWSVKMFQSAFIVSLSNGTIFSFNTDGTINWSHKFSDLAVSEINNLENGLFVGISDNGSIFWFYPNNGTIVKTFSIPTSYFTLSKVYKNYLVAGNNNGSIFVFNTTQSLYNKTIGSKNQQVLSLAINNNILLAYCYNSSLQGFSPTTGQNISIPVIKDIDYNSLFLNGTEVYITKTDGLFNRLDLQVSSVSTSKSPLYINNLLAGEFTGDGNNDLLAPSNTGFIYILKPNSVYYDHREQISKSTITAASKININNDGIDDLAIGTRLGEFYIVLGKDLTPPKIIEGSFSYNTSDTSITITFSANENVTVSINYHENTKFSNLTIGNDKSSMNQFIKISDLQPDTTYVIYLMITDSAGNIFSEPLLLIKTSPSPPPYLTYGSIGLVLVVGTIGTGYYYQRKRIRTKAFEEAERYYEAGEYILAIKSYIKANARDRIIDVVVFLASNPQLSYFVDEIKQMDELNAYMVDIQEIIRDQNF